MSSSPLPVESGFGGSRRGTGPSAERVLLAVLGMAVLFYFVVRGELGATLVLVGLYCAGCCVVHRGEVRRALREPAVQWLAIAFITPLVAAVLVNAVHHQAVWRSLDASLRFVLALAIFLELRRRSIDFTPVAAMAFPGSILLCTGLLMLPSAPTFFWDGRFATYFIDPIVLCQHVLIAAFICLFLVDPRAEPRWTAAVKIVAIGLALLVALGTQSRGGWLMVPILATVWLLRGRRMTTLEVSATVALVLLACLLAYWSSHVIRMRVDQVGLDVAAYTGGGDRDTSVGIRLSLFRTAMTLFAERPLLGWGYEGLPELRGIPALASFYTPALQSYFSGAGVHNEFLQAMMKMGTAGLVSRVLMYAVPLWIFIGACRSPLHVVRRNGYLGLVVVIGYITAGLTSEVTNLIYAASFYALLVAVFAAGALPRPAP